MPCTRARRYTTIPFDTVAIGGDYHTAVLDPSDGVTIWIYGAYPTSQKVWTTSVAAIRI